MQQKQNILVMHVNYTYFGDHFAIYTNIELLCCTPKTNIMVKTNIIVAHRAMSRVVGCLLLPQEPCGFCGRQK